jgi:predicted Fe-S protein YdhL (DUF1289 family)
VAKTGLSGPAAEALKEYEAQKTYHDSFKTKLEARYRSYRGIMERRSEAAQWTHKLTPPFANHIVETTLASLLDEQIKFRIRPRAKLYNPGEFALVKDGAKALEILLGFQLEADKFSEKQRWFVLQNMIAGVTAAKIYWRYSTRMKKRWGSRDLVIHDPNTGQPLDSISLPVVTEEPDTLFDGPCVEVCDVAHLVWDQHATSTENCRSITHEVFKTWEEMKELERAGVWQNVDRLKDRRQGEATAERSEWSNPMEDPKPADDKRFLIKEIWKRTEKGIRVFTICADVVLRDTLNPYWHGQYPFVIGSTKSDLFRIPGMSQVEKIAALQEQLWSTTNQRLDVLQLASSGILMINEDLVDDPDSIIFGPGEKMLARGDLKAALDIWGPDTTAAQISLPAENFLKQDMQNLAGGFPFTSTSEASNVKADTATEAALVSSMAQRSVSAAKINLNYMYRRIGQQMIELNQQYVTEPLIVTAVGADNEYELNEIVPEMLAGEWEFDISPMNESLNRQEKRAEAGAFMQQWLAAAPTISAMAQAGLAKMISMDAVVEDFLDAYDKGDKERYFVSAPPPGGLPGQSGQPGQGQPGGQQGTTAPQSIDPAVSPSNSMSLSPATAMSRFQAGQGGNNNIG